MTITPELIALFIFLAFVFAVAFAIVAVSSWLASRATAGDGTVSIRRVSGPTATGPGALAGFDRWFFGLLRQSGMDWHPTTAVLVIALPGLVLGGMLFLWREEPVPAVLGLLAGMAIPLVYLLDRRRKRIAQLHEQLPVALEMLARSVRAGESLDQAMAMVGSQSRDPLATEFRTCAKQLEMGMAMPSVMRLLVERVDLHDMRIFTTTLTVHRQSGGNIASVLDRLAHVIRDRLSYRRQLRVATGAAKASAILVAAIAPLLFIGFSFFRPEYFNAMLESQLGQMLLVLAAFSEIVGVIWTARLLKPTH